MIENAEGRKRKWFLILSLISNIGILAVFKYYNFIADNINDLLHVARPQTSIPLLSFILPIGLSFHTFQAMSYTIEVYRGNHKAERHFGIYSLYVMFYPQLVAGPIERPQNILFQFYQKKSFDYDNVSNGLKLMLWGLFKKAVIADRLALYTEKVFNHPHQNTSIDILVATIFFTFQIFCDFSGYTDIALGAAQVMGYKLMRNFDRPYSAKSISEFWKRWHISLSSWFNEYLFNSVVVPLRSWGNGAIIFGLMLTFFVSGLWHGAAWHYILWGGIHGLALTYESLTRKKRKKLFKKIPISVGNFISLFFTFSYVCISYIFFRANTVKEAWYMLCQVPVAIGDIVKRAFMHKHFAPLHITTNDFLVGIGLIGLLELIHYMQRKSNVLSVINGRPIALRWLVYYIGVLAIIFFGVFEERQFIYFQF